MSLTQSPAFVSNHSASAIDLSYGARELSPFPAQPRVNSPRLARDSPNYTHPAAPWYLAGS